MLSNTALGPMAKAAASHSRGSVERRLTGSLRRHAASAGWPNDDVRALSVKYLDGAFRIAIDETRSDSIMSREFGTQTRPPMGTLRQFEARMPAEAAEVAVTAITESLGEVFA